MEFIQNNKGSEKLCHDGYMYTKKSVSTTTKRWECARRKAFNCSGKIVTNLDVNETVSSIEHNHGQDDGMIEFIKLRDSVVKHTNKSRGTTKRAVADMLDTLTTDGMFALGNVDTVKRFIQRDRQKFLPKDPLSLEELEIPGEWTVTGGESPEPFLIYDSGFEEGERYIIFALKNSSAFS